MDVTYLVETAMSWINRSDEFVGEPEVSGQDRYLFAGACFDLAREHHAGVVKLVEASYIGSALALMRPLFEAYVRGIWLFKCADGSHLEAIRSYKPIPGIATQIDDLERLPEYNVGTLKRVKQESLKVMHGFTHGGSEQISRRINSKSIQPAFEYKEIFEVVEFANAVGSLTRLEILKLASDDERAIQYFEMIKEQFNNPLQPTRENASC